METQNQPTTAQTLTDKVRPSMAEAMKTATIGDQTRAYLILIGKLHDLYKEGYRVVEGDIHESEIDERMKDYCDGLLEAIRHIEYLLSWKMTQNYNTFDFYEHGQL